MSSVRNVACLLFVNMAVLASYAHASCVLSVTPPNPTILSGGFVNFTGNTTPNTCDQRVSWSASAGTINATGPKTATFTAPLVTVQTIVAVTGTRVADPGTHVTVNVTVNPPNLQSITLSPTSGMVTIGSTLPFTATGHYSDSTTQNITSTSTWSSTSPSIATVSAGVVTGVSDGSTIITSSKSSITSSGANVDVGTPADYYVATNGCDSCGWTGKLFEPNGNGTDGPFATIAGAQPAVQGAITHASTPITVLVRGGVYYGQALSFSSADSGLSSTVTVTWQNYPSETPVLSGGIRVTNWVSVNGNTYQATLPANTFPFENLFYNGQRRLRPRMGSGTLGSYFRIAATVYLASQSTNCSVLITGKGYECFDRFKYTAGDPVSGTWTNLSPPYPQGDIELIDFEKWTVPRMRIKSIDTTSHTIFLTGATRQVDGDHGFVVGHRYMIDNVKDLLTQAGQWFLDQSNPNSLVLTYLANAGENPLNTSTDTVVAPQSAQVLVATGLNWVTFKGLTFEHDNFVPPAAGYISTQQDPSTTEAVACYNCQNVTFDSDIITQTAGGGMAFKTTVSTATSSGDYFQNGAVYDIGANGIRVGNIPTGSDTENNLPQNITIQNNVIAGFGRNYPSGVGIVQGAGHNNLYTHNDIYDSYHSGIEVCLPQCFVTSQNPLGSHHNVSSFNHVYNLFQGVTDDSGGIYYATGTIDSSQNQTEPLGNQILNNKVHDTSDASIQDADGYGGHGIYMDTYTGQVDVENNLVYRVSGYAVQMTSGPQKGNVPNTVKNNILAYARLGIINNAGPYALNNTCPSSAVKIFDATNNLAYFDRDNTQNFYVQRGCEYSCGFPLTSVHNWQSNMYWRLNGTFGTYNKAFHIQPSPGSPNLCQGPGSWSYYYFSTTPSWQSLGEDSGSAVQNPGFANPAYPNDDYTLTSSPGVGFIVFDPTQAGRNNPVISSPTVTPTFPTMLYNPATDY
jgi:hypothetical protein